jgi:hypothetical protein
MHNCAFVGVDNYNQYWLSLIHIQPHAEQVTEAFTTGEKRSEREAYKSPPSGAEVKKGWSYTSIAYAFVSLIKTTLFYWHY